MLSVVIRTDHRNSCVSKLFPHALLGQVPALLPDAHEQSPFPAKLERPTEGGNDHTEK